MPEPSWEDEDSADPMQALRWELVSLWSDLGNAYRESRATPPETSGGCEHLIGRIHRITRIVGPVPPGHVGMTFLLTGMYEQVHARAGLAAAVPEDLLRQARDYEREQANA